MLINSSGHEGKMLAISKMKTIPRNVVLFTLCGCAFFPGNFGESFPCDVLKVSSGHLPLFIDLELYIQQLVYKYLYIVIYKDQLLPSFLVNFIWITQFALKCWHAYWPK